MDMQIILDGLAEITATVNKLADALEKERLEIEARLAAMGQPVDPERRVSGLPR